MRRSFIIVGGVSRRRSVFASSAGGGRCSGIAGCSGTGRRGPIMGVATITRSRNRRRAAPRPVRFRPRAGFRRGMAPPMPARRQPAGGDAGQGAEGRRILRRRQAARAGGPWAPRVRRAGGGPGRSSAARLRSSSARPTGPPWAQRNVSAPVPSRTRHASPTCSGRSANGGKTDLPRWMSASPHEGRLAVHHDACGALRVAGRGDHPQMRPEDALAERQGTHVGNRLERLADVQAALHRHHGRAERRGPGGQDAAAGPHLADLAGRGVDRAAEPPAPGGRVAGVVAVGVREQDGVERLEAEPFKLRLDRRALAGHGRVYQVASAVSRLHRIAGAAHHADAHDAGALGGLPREILHAAQHSSAAARCRRERTEGNDACPSRCRPAARVTSQPGRRA